MMEARPLTLAPLPYPYEALAPALSEDQVRAHYELHHAGYVRTANEILARVGGHLEGFAQGPSRSWERYVFNVNGARLHELFWATYTPGGRDLSRWLSDQIGSDLYSLRRDIVREAVGVQGSGWACLSMSKRDGGLVVHSVPNHDYPWQDLEPLIVLDVWEHSYYIDWRNERQRYAEALLALVDWATVEHRLLGRQPSR
jgi:Fe-Mn family superoxide dismutase